MKFDTCPRCGGEWNKDATILNFYKCTMCTMHITIDEGEFSLNIELFGFYIGWSSIGNYCIIYSRNKPIKLPWLPFDITEEKLKLYLVFS